jgi:hypothetical protein
MDSITLQGIKWDGKALRYFSWKVASLRSDAKGPIALIEAFEGEGWDSFFKSPLSPEETRKACSALNRACDGFRFCAEFDAQYVKMIFEGRAKAIRETQIKKREEEREQRRRQNAAE